MPVNKFNQTRLNPCKLIFLNYEYYLIKILFKLQIEIEIEIEFKY